MTQLRSDPTPPGHDASAALGGVINRSFDTSDTAASGTSVARTTAAHPSRHLDGEEGITKVRALLKQFRSAMLTTVVDGDLHARPMGLLGDAKDFSGTLWFFTDDRGAPLHEIGREPLASLIFQNDADSAYLQLSGRATQSRDRTKMQELFTPLLKTWFPEGLDDPHLTLIRFDATNGRFWDSPGGVFQLLGAFAKAVLTKEPAAGGEKGDVTLR